MATLPVKKGISSYAVTNIPKQWDQQWFRYFIDYFLANADIRNAATTGIVVSGNVSGNITTGSPNTNVTVSLSPIANNTVLGNVSGSTTIPTALSTTQLTTLINVFTAALSGAVPASGGGTVNFLRADGTWTTPPSDAPIPNDTVLGNVSGGSAVPVALTQTQLTTLINVFTSSLSGAVPASGGGTTKFLRADGTFNVPAYPVSANPSASVGLSAVNGSAATFMTSDSAPALSQAIVPTWTGIHTFSARPAFNLGATVSGGTFISRGITDNATSTILTIASNGGITTTAPSTGANSLTLNGNTANTTFVVHSGLPGTGAATDMDVSRAGSTVNSVLEGPSITLTDRTATTASGLQHSGGQFELWMTQNNGVTWSQALKVLTSNAITINAPTTGNTLVVNQFSSSAGISITGGTNPFIQTTDGTITGVLQTFTGGSTTNIGSQSNHSTSIITNNTARITVAAAGNVTIANALGINNASPPAQVTGFGTPTGTGVIANFPGATATLAQTSQAVAEIIKDLKAFGLYGA